MFSMTIFRLTVLMTFLLKGAESWKIEGTSFWIMLPGDGEGDAEATVSVAGDEGTTVTFTAQEPALSITDSIDTSGVFNLSLGPEHHIDILSDGDTHKAIHVVSDDSVAVNVLTRNSKFAMSYTANPQLVGGYFSHRVVTHCPENDTCNSVIAIVGMMNSPQIIVTVKTPTAVSIDGAEYTDGDVITVYIFQYEIALLRCKGDISGSLVFTPFPTNVFSGSYCDRNSTLRCDFTFEQIPPNRLLGSEFTIAPFPPSVPGFYRIVATKSNTVIVKDGSTTLTIIDEGQFYDVKEVLHISKIESSSPVLLTMFIIDRTSQYNHSNAMIVMQPLTENRKYHRVISPEGYRSYSQIESPWGHHENVWINSQFMCPQDVYLEQQNMSLMFVQMEQGVGNVACGDDHPIFGLVTYGFQISLAYGYSPLPGKPVESPENNTGACPSPSPRVVYLSTSSSLSEESVHPSMFGSSNMPPESSYRDTSPASGAQSGSLVQESRYSVHQGIFTSRTFDGSSSAHSTNTPSLSITMTSTKQDGPAETPLPSTDTDTNPFHVTPTTMMLLSTGSGTMITEVHTLRSESPSTPVVSVPSSPLTPTSVLGASASVAYESDLHHTGVYGSDVTNSASVYQPVSPSPLAATDMMVTSTIPPLLCSCPCWRQKLQGATTDIFKQLDSILHEVRKNLTLDKDTLSATIRKRISATDPRKSATGVGATGTGVVTFFFGLVVFGDIVSFVIGCVRWFGKPVNIKL